MHESHLDYFRPVNKIHAKCENAKRITGKTTAAAAEAIAECSGDKIKLLSWRCTLKKIYIKKKLKLY